MRLFFDNNLSPRLAHGSHQFVHPEHSVSHLKDRFEPTIEDERWMQQLAGEEGWIIVTADIRIGKNPHELQAWKMAGHTVFFLKPGWTDMTFWVQAYKFTKCFPDILSKAERARRGTAFIVSVNGKIE